MLRRVFLRFWAGWWRSILGTPCSKKPLEAIE
jgi:hypothetical protein